VIKNSDMKANRFFTWHKARRRVAAIVAHLEAGRTVYISTYTRSIKCTQKHVGMFRAARNGAFIQSGKHWDCIDGCKITVQA
jgi:hypothetical protein